MYDKLGKKTRGRFGLAAFHNGGEILPALDWAANYPKQRIKCRHHSLQQQLGGQNRSRPLINNGFTVFSAWAALFCIVSGLFWRLLTACSKPLQWAIDTSGTVLFRALINERPRGADGFGLWWTEGMGGSFWRVAVVNRLRQAKYSTEVLMTQDGAGRGCISQWGARFSPQMKCTPPGPQPHDGSQSKVQHWSEHVGRGRRSTDIGPLGPT